MLNYIEHWIVKEALVEEAFTKARERVRTIVINLGTDVHEDVEYVQSLEPGDVAMRGDGTNVFADPYSLPAIQAPTPMSDDENRPFPGLDPPLGSI